MCYCNYYSIILFYSSVLLNSYWIDCNWFVRLNSISCIRCSLTFSISFNSYISMKFYSILRIKYYIIIQQFVLMILISLLESFLYAIFECHFFLSVHFSHNSTIIFEHQNILLLHLRFIYSTNHSIHKLLLLNSPNIPFFLLTPSFDFSLLSFKLTNLHFFIRNMQF